MYAYKDGLVFNKSFKYITRASAISRILILHTLSPDFVSHQFPGRRVSVGVRPFIFPHFTAKPIEIAEVSIQRKQMARVVAVEHLRLALVVLVLYQFRLSEP